MPNATGETEEYVENNGTEENEAVVEETTEVEEPEEVVEKCLSTYRCCKTQSIINKFLKQEEF